jgi:type II secretory pathway pseudopilin PulG
MSCFRTFLVSTAHASILLEVILAVAIFTAAALVVLRQVSFASDAVQRARDQERAADLARSAMAMIEAGLETPETLSGPMAPARVAYGLAAGSRTAPTAESYANWEMTVEVNPSPFEGLTKVRVTAVWGNGTTAERARFSVAQLVRLSASAGGDSDTPADRRSR